MPVSNSGVKDRFFRVYDGASPSRHYVQFFQLEQPTLPMMEPRPTTAIQLDGGRATNYMVTYIDNEQTPFEPIEVTLRVMHMSQSLELIDALGNPRRKASWVIGGHTWTGLALNALGVRQNSDGVNVSALYPKDVQQQTRMVSLCWGYNVPADAPVGTAFFCEAKGVVVTNVQDVPEGQLMYFDVTAQIWGEINPNLSAWPAGIESTPS